MSRQLRPYLSPRVKEKKTNVVLSQDILQVATVTWNVASTQPPLEFKQLTELANDAHLVIVGLQEIQCDVYGLLMENEPLVNTWIHSISMALETKQEFSLIAVEYMAGLVIMMYILSDLSHYVSGISRAIVSCGAMNSPNKGAVGIRVRLGGQTLCMVNMHLSAHSERVLQREKDYNKIVNEMRFDNDPQATFMFHSYVIVLGDLNYRVNKDYDTTVKMIQDGKHLELRRYDQLSVAQKNKLVLTGFYEKPIEFAPTFKFDQGTLDTYDTSLKRRVPSWTDRILYRGKGVSVLKYDSWPEIVQSDHKPVYAMMEIKLIQPISLKSAPVVPMVSRRKVKILTPFGLKVLAVVMWTLIVIGRILPIFLRGLGPLF